MFLTVMSAVTDTHLDCDPDVLDSQQAAQVLGLSVDALRKRIARGTVDGFKSNGRWYIRNTDVKNDIIALMKHQILVKDEQIRELHTLLAKALQTAIEAAITALPSPSKPWWKIWS